MKKIEVDPKEKFKVIAGTERSQAAVMVLESNTATGGPDNRHGSSDQWLYIISGEGVAIVNGKESVLKPKTLLLIEAGEKHEIKNTGNVPLQTLNFYCPPEY